jgi:hypothetical protein
MSAKTMQDETKQMGWPIDCHWSLAVAAVILTAIAALFF